MTNLRGRFGFLQDYITKFPSSIFIKRGKVREMWTLWNSRFDF